MAAPVKTSLAEAMLFDAGVINRLGRIEEGNTALDFEPEEIKRTSSISTGFHQLPWKKHTITLMDTPGDQNFFSDTKTCLQAADAAVVVIDAVDGVKVQTEIGWEFVDDFKLPRAIFINKLDRERADFQRTFEDAKGMFQPKPIILQLPIGAEAGFKGRGRPDHPQGLHVRRGRKSQGVRYPGRHEGCRSKSSGRP